MSSREEFYEYVLSFYNGQDGLYKDVDATRVEVVAATNKMERIYEDICYDSVDRERVRDLIIEGRK